MKYNRIAFLDTETTDVYWNTTAPIQIAAIVCDNQGNVIDSFNERIKTTHKISPDASKVHGIYAKDLENCRREREVLIDFCVWLKTIEVDAICTYNGNTFDLPMLELRCQKLDVDSRYFDRHSLPTYDIKDTVIPARQKNLFGLGDKLGRKWKLTLVSEILGISTEHAHDALADVYMAKEVFFKLDPYIHPEKWGLTTSLL